MAKRQKTVQTEWQLWHIYVGKIQRFQFQLRQNCCDSRLLSAAGRLLIFLWPLFDRIFTAIVHLLLIWQLLLEDWDLLHLKHLRFWHLELHMIGVSHLHLSGHLRFLALR